MIGLLKRTFVLKLEIPDSGKTYVALIRPHLEYPVPITWNPHLVDDIEKFELIQIWSLKHGL